MYFVWESRRTSPEQALISKFASTASLYGVSFTRGRKISRELPLLEVLQDEESQGVLTDDLVIRKRRCLVHSDKLINVLADAGVDNIDYYPVYLKNIVSGRDLRTFLPPGENAAPRHYYQAANIVDEVFCLDKDASVLEYNDENPKELWYIHDMKILEDRIQGVDMFRLGEDSSIVIVSDRVRSAVEASNCTGVCFVPADGYRDYQGYAFDNPRNVIGTHDDDPHGAADAGVE